MPFYITTAQRRAAQKLWSLLDKNLLPHAQNGCILAVSGGPDSRALMESIAIWPNRHKASFIVASFDHGIRKESKEETFFLLARAKMLGFRTAFSFLENSNYKNEHDLRTWRYEKLYELASQNSYSTIVLAHHLDDNAEGFLMSLYGSGGGYFGASMKNYYQKDGLFFVRPFLNLNKKDLLLFLTLHKQTDFCIDSNDELSIGERAKIRNDILPVLKKGLTNISQRLNEFAINQEQQNDTLEKMAKKLVFFTEKEAFIEISNDIALMRSALIYALSKLIKNKDFRSSKNTLNKLLEAVTSEISKINNKKYVFSGVTVDFVKNKLRLIKDN